jgi:hypothetical protein
VDSALVSSNVSATSATAWSASTVYVLGDIVQYDATNSHRTFQSKLGVTSTVTITIASPAVVTMTGHGQVANTPWQASTTGTLPTGIVAGTVYYILAPTANTFNLSATPGGAAINTTGTQSGTHTAKASLNYNKNPSTDDGTNWINTGSTNRWKMFDQSVQSQTTNSNTIDAVVTFSSIVDTVAFLNLSAQSVRVKVTHPVDGILYDQTQTLTSSSGITDWYTYFFTPIRRKTDIVFYDLPKYSNVQIEVIVSNTGGTAGCGGCIFGQTTDISSEGLGVEHGAKLGIQDYSIKSTDDFGNFNIVQRAFNRRTDFNIFINNTDLDYVYNLLSERRAIPTLYIGSSRFGSTLVYGFYKDFSIDISYYDCSVVSITLEGLT